MKFIIGTLRVISFLLAFVFTLSLLAALVHYLLNGENDKVTVRLIVQLSIFSAIFVIATYYLNILLNGFGSSKKQYHSPFRYSKQEAAPPNVPFNI